MVVATPADCTSLWTYPIENDGWFRAHNALRADMDALDRMIKSFQHQLDGGKPITASQSAAATRFVQCFLEFLHHHHHCEDDIATPYIATRCTVPAKIAADHAELDVLQDRFEAATKDLLAESSLVPEKLIIVQREKLVILKTAFSALQPVLLDHLREEEAEAMPLMRRHFTPQEIERNVVQKIMRGMDNDGLGTFFHPMTKAERRGFARQEGIPFFIRWILFSKAGKYERRVWQPFQRECLAAA